MLGLLVYNVASDTVSLLVYVDVSVMVLPLLHPDAAKIQAIANNKTNILFI